MAKAKLVGHYKNDPRMPIYLDQVDKNRYYLKQNPDTQSIFARGAQEGIEVYWVSAGYPFPGVINYTGEVYINKTKYDRFNARKVILDMINRKKEEDNEFRNARNDYEANIDLSVRQGNVLL